MESTELTLTVITSVFSAALSVIVGYLVYRLQKSDAKREVEAEQKRREDAEKEKETRESNSAIRNGLQCILRDRLIFLMQTAEKEGFAPVYTVQNVSSMYAAYHTLGGNGMVAQLYDHFQNLPHVQKGEKNHAVDK